MAVSEGEPPKSINNDTPTYVKFMNCTERQVHLFWLDYSGKLVRYGRIPPGHETSMNTFVTHPWIARDAATWYPLLLNGHSIFHPVAERGQRVFNDFNRDGIEIHIPVYPLFRRCLEVVYLNFRKDAIIWTNIPNSIKDYLLRMSTTSTNNTFKDYQDFDRVLYDRIHENDNDLADDSAESDDGGDDNGNI